MSPSQTIVWVVGTLAALGLLVVVWLVAEAALRWAFSWPAPRSHHERRGPRTDERPASEQVDDMLAEINPRRPSVEAPGPQSLTDFFAEEGRRREAELLRPGAGLVLPDVVKRYGADAIRAIAFGFPGGVEADRQQRGAAKLANLSRYDTGASKLLELHQDPWPEIKKGAYCPNCLGWVGPGRKLTCGHCGFLIADPWKQGGADADR